MEKRNNRKNNGITLIALIITIIIMLILVAVSIRIAIQTGLFDSAGRATQKWVTEQEKEANLKVNIAGTEYNSVDEYTDKINEEKIEIPWIYEENEDGTLSIIDIDLRNVDVDVPENEIYGTYVYRLGQETLSIPSELEGKSVRNVDLSRYTNSHDSRRVEDIKKLKISEGIEEFCNSYLYFSELETLIIPASLTEINFMGDNNLSNIVVDEKNNVYDSRENCNAIIKTNTNELIKGCNTSIIPSSVTSIGNSAFSGCSGLTSIEIPSSVTNIEKYAFSYCSGLTSIEIPSSVTSIGDNAFSGCSGLTGIEFHSSVTNLGEYVFQHCDGLRNVVIPGYITAINEGMFYGCAGLENIEFSEGVRSVDYMAFASCDNLTTITFPVSLEDIDSLAFRWCDDIETVNYRGTKEQWIALYGAETLNGVSVNYNYTD